LNPAETANHFDFHVYLTNLSHWLFIDTWSWWASGLGIGLTALGLAWFTGRRLGVTGGFEDAWSVLAKGSSFSASPSRWKLWFILGIPFGGFLANAGHWSWTWLYGRLDALTFGSLAFKILWLLVAGFLVGFGARWAGGCVSGNSIMGIPTGNKMSMVVTLAFLASGIIVTNLVFSLLGVK
jgi:uncharacterized membrane protein YedE/YeeE